jgi:protein-tyrosine-phosphatase
MGVEVFMKKILFVCTGNTCRSPIAAAIFNDYIKQNKIDDVIADSAGILAKNSDYASQNAVKALRELNVDIRSHRAKQLTEQLINQSDEIYAMTEQHKNIIEKAFPQSSVKVFLVYPSIDDPFGGDLDEYRKCRDKIKLAVEKIIKKEKPDEQF